MIGEGTGGAATSDTRCPRDLRRSVAHPRSFVYRVDLSAPAFGRTWNGGLAAPTIADIDAVIWK